MTCSEPIWHASDPETNFRAKNSRHSNFWYILDKHLWLMTSQRRVLPNGALTFYKPWEHMQSAISLKSQDSTLNVRTSSCTGSPVQVQYMRLKSRWQYVHVTCAWISSDHCLATSWQPTIRAHSLHLCARPPARPPAGSCIASKPRRGIISSVTRVDVFHFPSAAAQIATSNYGLFSLSNNSNQTLVDRSEAISRQI